MLTVCVCAPLQIWVVSRHYGDDLHMSNLLERIAHGIQASGGRQNRGVAKAVT